MAYIKIIAGERKGDRIEIDRDEVTVGRSPSCVVHINHESVSGKHCTITREGRRFTLNDLDSTNGTRLNGVRVTSYPLSANDVVAAGSIEFQIVGDDIDNHAEDVIPPTIVQSPTGAGTAAPPTTFKPRKHTQGLWIGLGVGVGALVLVVLAWFIVTLATSS